MKDLSTMSYIDDLCMSNFDLSVDEGLAERLTANEGKVFAQHAALNFCGNVWFEDGKFHNQIHQSYAEVDELEAETLEGLMEIANDKYGSG